MQITIASGKGGVGKSSITSSLIYLISKSKKVIAVDADADAPNLSIVFGVRDWDFEKPLEGGRVAVISSDKCKGCGICQEHCPYECIYRKGQIYRVEEVICEGCNVCSLVCPYDDVISFKPSISGVVKGRKTDYGFYLISADLFPGRPNSGKLVFMEKQIAREKAEEENANYIIIDSAAGIGCQVIASINGSDALICVVEPSPSSFNDFKRLLKVAEHFKIKVYLLINKFDINEKFTKSILAFAEEEEIEPIGNIPYDDHVIKAISAGKPVCELFPDSPFSVAIKEVLSRILNL
jgi:MinD superfamily P-loop ATPase